MKAGWLKMTTLKKARESGKLDQFIKEREKDPPGNRKVLEKAITSLASGKSKSVPGTSRKPARGR